MKLNALSLGMILSPSQEGQPNVCYRTSTPVSSASDTKTSQGSQTYLTEVKSLSSQTQFGTVDIKPSLQQLHFDKSNSTTGNFLAQGHHPQNLATEGGGVWDFPGSCFNLFSG